MTRLKDSAIGKTGAEDLMLATQADREAWHGRLRSARKLTQRANDSAQHSNTEEAAAGYEAVTAVREAAVGNLRHARVDAVAALKLAQNSQIELMAALALAQAGDIAAAENLAKELDKTHPLDTLVQHYWLPTIPAAVALERKDPGRAVDLLAEMNAGTCPPAT
jgi:hypothetical protein